LFFISFVAIILGIAIEYLQGIVTVDRNSDLYDVLANSLGVLTGAFFSYLFLNKKQ
jgi:VanZ family protein